MGWRGVQRGAALVVGPHRRTVHRRRPRRLGLRLLHHPPPSRRRGTREGGGMTGRFVLALDQGTTSSRSIVFGRDGRAVATAQREFPQIFPGPGLVEHDPEAIWTSQLETAREALAEAGAPASDVAAIGITNQRETTILWDRQTGKAVANAIVWQSRVSAPICDRLK